MIYGNGTVARCFRGPMTRRDFDSIKCEAPDHEHRPDGSGRDDGDGTDGEGRCMLAIMAPCHVTSEVQVAYDRIDHVLLLRCSTCRTVFCQIGVAP